MFGRRVAADGQLLELQPKLITTGDVVMPDIEYADGTYMIATKGRVTDAVLVTVTDTSLNATSGNILVGPGDFPGPQLASNGSEFLVVGESAYRVSTAGQVLDASGIALGGTHVDWSGNVTPPGTRRIGPWHFAHSSGDLGMQRIDAVGVLVDVEPTVVAADVMNEQVAVAGSQGESLVIFSDRPGLDQDIRVVHFDNMAAGSSPLDVSVGLSRQSFVTSVDGPANENLMVYVSQISGETRLLSQRVADDGTVLDLEPTVVAVESSTVSVVPDVAWNGTDYLITWSHMAQRVSASNQVLGAPIVVGDYPVRTVAAAGDTFVIGSFESYVVFHQTYYWIYYSRVAADGTLLDAEPVRIGGGSPGSMDAASMGDRVIMSYTVSQGVFIEADGTLSAPFQYNNSSGSSTSIAVNGSQALFVYTVSGSGPNDTSVMGRFVYDDGSAPDFEFPIADAPGLQLDPSVAWIGDQFVVAWSDYRHVEGVEQQRGNIRAARVTSSGIVREPNGFTVTSTASPEDLPDRHRRRRQLLDPLQRPPRSGRHRTDSANRIPVWTHH